MSSSSKKSSKPFSRNAGDWTCPDKSWVSLSNRKFLCLFTNVNVVIVNFSAAETWTLLAVTLATDAMHQNPKTIRRRRVRLDMQQLRIHADYSGKKIVLRKSNKTHLFCCCSADDWSCLKCGNINWARRSSCNICNAKKFADDQRTGNLVF